MLSPQPTLREISELLLSKVLLCRSSGPSVTFLTNPNTGVNWSQFSFTEMGTGSDTISFSFRDDPAYMALDNVSVVPSAVPERSNLAMLLGFGAFNVAAVLGVRRRKLI